MKKYEIKFPVELLKASVTDRIIALNGIGKMLGLEKSKKRHNHPHLRPGDGENKIIAELESKYYTQLWERKKLNDTILKYIKSHKLIEKEISPEENKKFRKFLSDIFELPLERIGELVVRSFLAGALVELGEKPVALDLETLPLSVKEAIKQGKMTWEQARFVKMAQILAGEHIAGVSEAVQHRIRDMIIESNINGEGISAFSQRLFGEFDDESMMNRDMERIAITEMNTCANAGFISGCREGEYVIGLSHKDACGWCKDNIQGKILKVIDKAPPEYANLSPGSDKYETIAKIWDSCIWATKTNYGRSTAKRIRAGKEWIDREHHELASPAVLCHISGRCKWLLYSKEYMYVKDGVIKYVSNDEEDAERLKWLKEHPEIK